MCARVPSPGRCNLDASHSPDSYPVRRVDGPVAIHAGAARHEVVRGHLVVLHPGAVVQPAALVRSDRGSVRVAAGSGLQIAVGIGDTVGGVFAVIDTVDAAYGALLAGDSVSLGVPEVTDCVARLADLRG